MDRAAATFADTAERSAPAAVEEHAIRSVPYGPAPVGWPGDTHLPRNVANRQDACLSAQPLAAFAMDHSTGNNAAVACSRRSAWGMAVGFLRPERPACCEAGYTWTLGWTVSQSVIGLRCRLEWLIITPLEVVTSPRRVVQDSW